MKTIAIQTLMVMGAAFLVAPLAQAATVTFNASESQSQGPNGAAVDFAGTDNPLHMTYGTAGYILYATNPTFKDSSASVSNKDPLLLNEDGYTTLNTLSASDFTVKSLDQDYILKSAFGGGVPLDKSSVYFIGAAGSSSHTADKVKVLAIKFNHDSASGFRIAILTRPVGPNGMAVSGVTMSSGSSSAKATPFDETNTSPPNAIAFYSFDVKDIKAGDVVTLTLSQPTTEGNILYNGLTIDPLSASAGH